MARPAAACTASTQVVPCLVHGFTNCKQTKIVPLELPRLVQRLTNFQLAD